MQTIDNTWGYAPREIYQRRWALIREHLTKPQFVLIDWGSDSGWFSVKTAHEFPASVVSVEAGLMSDSAGLRLHEEKRKAYGADNDLIVKCLFGPKTFAGLQTVPADYQFALSIFHHMGDGFGSYLNTVAEWDAVFCDLIRGANVTFFEIPNEGHLGETPHRIRAWYNGQDVETVIRNALDRGGVSATVAMLGETLHGDKGPRKLFKISLDSPIEPASAQNIIAFLNAPEQRIQMRPYRRLRMQLGRLLRGSRVNVVNDHQD